MRVARPVRVEGDVLLRPVPVLRRAAVRVVVLRPRSVRRGEVPCEGPSRALRTRNRRHRPPVGRVDRLGSDGRRVRLVERHGGGLLLPDRVEVYGRPGSRGESASVLSVLVGRRRRRRRLRPPEECVARAGEGVGRKRLRHAVYERLVRHRAARVGRVLIEHDRELRTVQRDGDLVVLLIWKLHGKTAGGSAAGVREPNESPFRLVRLGCCKRNTPASLRYRVVEFRGGSGGVVDCVVPVLQPKFPVVLDSAVRNDRDLADVVRRSDVRIVKRPELRLVAGLDLGEFL